MAYAAGRRSVTVDTQEHHRIEWAGGPSGQRFATTTPLPGFKGSRAVNSTEPAQCVSPDDPTIDNEVARTLWESLTRARSDLSVISPVISTAEDAVFRFYLPLAKALAHKELTLAVDPELAEEAAELGLAKAVLSWRRPDTVAFTAFARLAIQAQIWQIQSAQIPFARRDHRPTAART